MELRKIDGNGVKLEVKLKAQGRWSGVEVETSGGGSMNKLMIELEWSCRKCLWSWSGSGGRDLEF